MAATCTPAPVDRVAPLDKPQGKDIPWKPEEMELVDDAWDVAQAWENYRAEFGTARTYGAIKMRWYRAHKKLPSLEVLLGAFLKYQKKDAESLTLMTRATVVDTITLIETLLQEYQENPDDLIRKANEKGWLKSWH